MINIDTQFFLEARHDSYLSPARPLFKSKSQNNPYGEPVCGLPTARRQIKAFNRSLDELYCL